MTVIMPLKNLPQGKHSPSSLVVAVTTVKGPIATVKAAICTVYLEKASKPEMFR